MTQIKPLALFFVLIIVFAIAFEGAMVVFGFNKLIVTALMWSAGISALIALKLTGNDFSSLGWKWGAPRYHLFAFAAPIIYGSVAYFGASAAGLVTFPSAEALAQYPAAAGFQAVSPGIAATLLIIATAGMVGSMSMALGEEIGWRGFMTPRLTALMGFVAATLVSGVIWACWHLPMVVLSAYNSGGDTVFEIGSFVVMVVAACGVYAWIRLQSGSLWPAVTLHASHNLFIQTIFDPLTIRGSNPITMVSEFGVVMAAVVVVFSLPFWFLGARRFKREAKV